MANEKITLRKGPSTDLNTVNVPIVEGQISITTDTGKVYLDTDSSTRLELCTTASSATQATQDSDGNVIKNTYVKKSGDTMTGGLGFNSNTAVSPNISTNLVTGRYGDGAAGKAIINSTATAGDYVAIAKTNSNNGHFTISSHGTTLRANYSLDDPNSEDNKTGAGIASTTYSAVLLDEDGSTRFPGPLSVETAPSQNNHVTTKKYVDNSVNTCVPKTGGIMTGALTLSGAPSNNLHAATKKYVDDSVPKVVTQSTNGLMIAADKKKIDESFTNGRKPNTTQGDYSTAIGYPDNEASARGSITLGSNNTVAVASYSGASSDYGIAIGKSNTVQGRTESTKNSNYAISLGYNNQSTAQGAISVGMNNTSTRYSSIAIGDGNAANAVKSVSIGANNSIPYNITVDGTTYEGYGSIGIGTNNKSYGEHAIAIGSGSDSSGSEIYNLAQGTNAIAIGYANTAKGTGATAIGYDNEVTANKAAALGSANVASGFASVVGGFRNHATGAYTTMFGRGHNYFDDFGSNGLTMVGRYGYIVKRGNYGALADNTQNGDAFIIGAGYADQQEIVEGGATWTCFNAFRVTQNGAVFAHEQNVHGADYAEYVKEWGDGNPTHEDRVGYMVTIKNNKLEKANANDYIIGITSGNPAIVGNSDDEYFWRYETDDFNRIVYEDVEGIIVTTDENGNDVVIKTGEIVKKPKLNQNYNPQLRDSYISRSERPEWDYVGMRGIVPVRDDGTCVAGGFCKCGGNGIATYTSERGFDTYYVIERISENVVSVEVK